MPEYTMETLSPIIKKINFEREINELQLSICSMNVDQVILPEKESKENTSFLGFGIQEVNLPSTAELRIEASEHNFTINNNNLKTLQCQYFQ